MCLHARMLISFLLPSRDCHLQSSPDQSSVCPASLTAYLQQGRLSSFSLTSSENPCCQTECRSQCFQQGTAGFPLQATPPALANPAFLQLPRLPEAWVCCSHCAYQRLLTHVVIRGRKSVLLYSEIFTSLSHSPLGLG